MSREPTTSAGCRSMVSQLVSTWRSAAACVHRSRSQNVRGSLTTIWEPRSWVPNHSRSSVRSAGSVVTSAIRSTASGRPSSVRTPARASTRLWYSTAHFGSK